MGLLILSFLAGVLTVAAPCVLPLLPVIVGGSIVRGGEDSSNDPQRDWMRPLVICGSLVVSVVVFTLLLKATTALLGIPQVVWSGISGLIIVALGVYFIRPQIWDGISAQLNLSGRSGRRLTKAKERGGLGGDILLGAALGPAFNSCSPTYALIVATILPASLGAGLGYLAAYALGLGGTLLVIAYAGQGLVKKLGWLSNPNGAFRNVIGALLILIGLAVLFGLDRTVQTFILDQGWYDPIIQLEQRLGL